MRQLLICNHTHYIEKKRKNVTSLILYTIFITFVVESNNEFKGFQRIQCYTF